MSLFGDLQQRAKVPLAPAPAATSLTTSDLDAILTAQLVVGWAGEKGEERRLGWWRSDLVSEFGGEDLFRRLLPHTWRWATLQATREAARRHDAELRARAHDADTIVSLFRLGFAIDERVDERLQDLKRGGQAPGAALLGLQKVMGDGRWSAARFLDWAREQGDGAHTTTPIGRQLRGTTSAAGAALVGRLVAALAPLGDSYPLPHARRTA